MHDTFFALLMTDSDSKQAAMMELCVWQLTDKLEKTADEAYFFTSLEPNIKDFRPNLKEKA